MTTIETTCDARLGWAERPEGWGRTPIYCRQQVGLTSFRDAVGRTRRHCSRAGHRAAAVRRFGEWVEPESVPEAYRVVCDIPGCAHPYAPVVMPSPESADPITAAKAAADRLAAPTELAGMGR